MRHRVRTVLIDNSPGAGAERVLGLLDGLAADIRLLGRADLPAGADAALSRFGGWLAVQVRDKPVRNWDEL